MSEVTFNQARALGVITLTRASALNALTLGMVRAMYRQLQLWLADSSVEAIVIQSEGEKAFCAGGDIRALYDWGKAGAREAQDFYREEYRLNYAIASSTKPYAALLQGVTMGGGAGVALHGRSRLLGPNFSFAMPETGIGLFPDVGGSYFLSRLPSSVGVWLALTGARLNAADACWLRLGTHYVADVAAARGLIGEGAPLAALYELGEPPPESALPQRAGVIAKCFAHDSVPAIEAALRNEGSEWAQAQAAAMATKSPLSLCVALRQIRAGADLDLAACLQMEMRLAARMMAQADFYEGVRALIVDKDRKPRWEHRDAAAVGRKLVDAIFSSLGDKELRLN